EPGWHSAYEIVQRFKVLTAAEFTTTLAKEHNHVAGILESPAHDAIGVFEHANHADDGRRIDRFAVGLVVEADVAAGDRHVQRATRFANTFDRSRELPHDRRPLRITEIQTVCSADRKRTRTRDVSRRFRYGQHRPTLRIEVAVPAVAIDR